MIRCIAFLGVVCLALFTPVWAFVVGAIIYVFVYTPAFEVCLLGVCIDALFGERIYQYWYIYTLLCILIVIGMTFLKPYVRTQ